MKRYIYNIVYKHQQITKEVCAKNVKEAAEKLGTNTYNVTKYCNRAPIDEPFEGVIAYFDSGELWRTRKDLIRVKMPYEELKSIIDAHRAEQSK